MDIHSHEFDGLDSRISGKAYSPCDAGAPHLRVAFEAEASGLLTESLAARTSAVGPVAYLTDGVIEAVRQRLGSFSAAFGLVVGELFPFVL
jgi:hypothetical protein